MREQTELQTHLLDRKKSNLAKYQDMVIGKPGLADLLKYELMTFLLAPMPGALGLWLRGKLYPHLLGKIGRNIIMGRNITLRHPHKIRLGSNIIIDDNCVLDAKGEENEGITIGDNVSISRNTILACKNGTIEIGEGCLIGINCMIHSEKMVKLGKYVLIAAYCYIIGGGDHNYDRTDIPIMAQGTVSKGIVIEDDVWLGAGVKISDGVTIGTGSIIGTSAVVLKDIPPYSIAYGVPAKVIKSRKPREDEFVEQS